MSKVIVITGASSGFGKLAALKFAREGHIIYGVARRLDLMQDIVNAGAQAFELDITDSNQIALTVNRVLSEQKRIDVLINNAGLGVYDFVESADLEAMRSMFDVNFWGLVELTQQVLPHMRAQGAGRIINVSSLAGKVSLALLGFYAATKHAVEAVSDALRQEVAQFGIHVSLIEPGVFATEFETVVNDNNNTQTVVSAYQTTLDQFKASSAEAYKRAPHPKPVINAMVHAVTARKPKTRYLVGVDAKSAMAARRWMSDSAFDRLIARAQKLL